MNHEEQVKLGHARRESIATFFDFLDLLTPKELELSRARLADRLEEGGDQLTLARGILIHRYISLREAGARKLRKFSRRRKRSEVVDSSFRASKREGFASIALKFNLNLFTSLEENSGQAAWIFIACGWNLDGSFSCATEQEVLALSGGLK
jgi:hypothetical protein